MQQVNSVAGLNPVQLARFVKDVGKPLLEVNPIPPRLPSLKVGEEVTARVVNTLPDNRFVVMVKNNLLTLNVSTRGEQALGAEPGSLMKLKVASVGPRLTFTMASEVANEPVNRSMSRVTLSGATRYLSALLLQARSQFPSESGEPRLSARNTAFGRDMNWNNQAAGKVVDFGAAALGKQANLTTRLTSLAKPWPSQMAGVGPLVNTAPHIKPAANTVNTPTNHQTSATPTQTNDVMMESGELQLSPQQKILLSPKLTIQDTALPDSQTLAAGLKKLVSSSGLFYESHLKEWFKGERPLAELLEQPQAKAELPRAILNLLKPTEGQTIDEALLANKLADFAGKGANKESSSVNMSPLLGQIVSKQLDVFEFRQVAFQGELWPGQSFILQIEQPPEEQRTEERQAYGSEEERTWHTRLAMDLPSLGGVEARLSVGPQGVSLHFVTERGDVAQLIDTHRTRLQQGFLSAGLSLNQFQIDRGSHD